LIVAVVACIASLAIAQTCPASSLATAYSDNTCATTINAATSACSCIGLTYSSTTGGCVGVSSALCSQFASCANSYIATLNLAAATGSSCSSLASIQTLLVGLAAGGTYTGSSLQTACQRTVCQMANASTNGCSNNLNQVFTTACVNPYAAVYTITVNGVPCTTSLLAVLIRSLGLDLLTATGQNATGTAGSCGSFIGTYVFPVSSANAGLTTSLSNLQSNPALLTNLAAAAGVSPSALTVTSIVQVSTPVPGSSSPNGNGFILSSARASWTAVSVLAAAVALLF